jgi:hypothetical protein
VSIYVPSPVCLLCVFFKKLVQFETFLKLNDIFHHDGNSRLFSGFHYASTTGSIAEARGYSDNIMGGEGAAWMKGMKQVSELQFQ